MDKDIPKTNRQRMLKGAFFLVLLLSLILPGLYFLLTSAFFIREFVVPRVEKNLDATIELEGVSLSVWKGVELRHFHFESRDGNTAITADALRLNANLLDLYRGRLKIRELHLEAPRISHSPGSAVTTPGPVARERRSQSGNNGLVSQMDIQSVLISNGSLQLSMDSIRTLTITNAEVHLDRLAPSFPGQTEFSWDFVMEQSLSTDGSQLPSRLEGGANGTLEFDLNPDGIPTRIEQSIHLAIHTAQGRFAGLEKLKILVATDMETDALKQMAIQFSRSGNSLGQITLQGPINPVDREARLKLEISSLDRNALNLLTATQGYDFENSQISGSGILDVSRKGTFIVSEGTFSGRDISLRRDSRSLPPCDMDLDYQIHINLKDESLLIRRLSLSVKDKMESELLRGTLTRPMNLAFGGSKAGFRESSFDLRINHLDLAEWKLFTSPWIDRGILDASLTTTAKNDGQRMEFSGKTHLSNLDCVIDSRRVSPVQVDLSFSGNVMDYQKLHVDTFVYDIQHRLRPLTRGEGTLDYRSDKSALQLRLSSRVELPQASEIWPIPQFSPQQGSLKTSLLFTRRPGDNDGCVASVLFSDFTGQIAGQNLSQLHASLDLRAEKNPEEILVKKATLRFKNDLEEAGLIDASGEFNSRHREGEFQLEIVDFNEHFFRSLLAGQSTVNEILGISIHAKLDGRLTPPGGLTLSGTLDARDLQWTQADADPLDIRTTLEGSWNEGVLILDPLDINLPHESGEGQNRLRVSSHWFSDHSQAPHSLTLQSDRLDISLLYAMFQSRSPGETASTGTNSPQAESKVVLPNLEAEVDIHELILNDLTLTNLVTQLEVADNRLTLAPLHLGLNGSPLSLQADVHLGHSPPRFDIDVHGENLPVEAVMHSLFPENPGELNGQAFLNVALNQDRPTNAGMNPLQGELQFHLTDAQIPLVGSKYEKLVSPVATILGVPELRESPVEELQAVLEIHAGRVQIHQMNARSGLFRADLEGAFPLAREFSQSRLDLPVHLKLKRSVAERAHLVEPDAQPGEEFISVPDFVRITGTPAAPKATVTSLLGAAVSGGSVLGIDTKEIEKYGDEINAANEVLQIIQGRSQSDPDKSNPDDSEGTKPDPIQDIIRRIPF